MQRSESSALAAILLIGAMSVAAEDATIVRHPLEVGTAVDIGQIVKGERDDFTSKPTDGQILQRTAVYLNQVTTVNNRLEIRVGVGGMFFYGYPEGLKPESRAVRFGPGVGQAQGIFMFGDPENPYLRAQIGFFPYKYNPDAKNLGEYLLRSGTYPGYEVTGGWSLLNSANYMASGLRLHGSMMEGKLNADLNLFMERDLDPIYDISPSILATYKPSNVFEIGAGAQFSHLIPVAPRKVKGRYWRYDETSTDTIKTQTAAGTDTSIVIAAPILVTAGEAGPNAQRYTFAGTKLMARAALNLGALFDSPFIGPEGLKFYTEVALLGVKDYPYFYAKKIQRMPIMLGLNLPTFGFFDMLSVEYEYRQWGFPNSTADVQDNFEPVYTIPNTLDSTFDGTTWTKGLAQKWYKYDPNHPVYYVDESGGAGTGPFTKVNVSEGNQKWSIYMKKQFLPGFAIYAQAASDHLRLIRYADNTFSREVTTRKPSQWYYVVRLDFGI